MADPGTPDAPLFSGTFGPDTKPAGTAKTTTASSAPPPFVPAKKEKKKAQAKGYEWEGAVADGLGLAYSPGLKRFLDAWHTADQSDATNNPFNITVDYTGTATGDFNSVGVKNFPSAIDGINATVAFIKRNVPNLLGYLSSGDYNGAAQYLERAGWAGSSTTYAESILSNFRNGTYRIGNNAPNTLSPSDKTRLSTITKTAQAQSDVGSTTYIQSAAELSAAKSAAVAQAKAVQHLGENAWATLVTDGSGRVSSIKPVEGENPPKNTIKQGGQPLTMAQVDAIWSQRYEGVFEQYAGRTATGSDIANVLSKGLSVYAVQQQLAGIDPKTGKFTPNQDFTRSPAYKSSAAAIIQRYKETLGHAPTAAYVAKALAYGWNETDQDAEMMKLPGYEQGPKFKAEYASSHAAYRSIYGEPDALGKRWLTDATRNGWSQQQIADALRAAPEYVHSQEYATNAADFLDALGLLSGQKQAALKPVHKTPGRLNPQAPLAPKAAAA